MSIQGIKLTTGEELVAKVVSFDANAVTVKDPLVLHMSSGKDGFVINFLPWSIIAEGPIPIYQHAISSRFDVPKEVEDNYLQNTTGLQIVSGAAGASQLVQG
jgi:hypothetical protein